MIGALCAAAATLLAVALVLWPLLRLGAERRVTARQARLAVLAARLRGAEQAVAAGSIAPADLERDEREIAAEVAEALAPAANRAAPAARPWTAALLVALLLPPGAWLTYLAVGNPASLLDIGSPALARNAEDGQQMARTEELAGRLQARLAAGSNDPEAWVLLARTYRTAGKTEQALGAYRQATQDAAASADILIEHASALVDRNDKRFDAAADALVARALATEPGNLNALAMAGAAAMQRGNRADALRHWRKLHAAIPEEQAEDRARAASLVALASGGNVAPAALPPAAAGPSVTTGAPAAGPSAMARRSAPAGPLAPTGPPATAGKTALAGVVVIAEALAARVPEGGTLFVFARPPDGAPMPIAALRLSPKSFPAAFGLDDSHSMIEGTRLSAFPSVRLVARISRGGDATRRPGDLEGSIDRVALGSGHVRLLVNRIVE